ncbi:MAG: exo-alpha-sialidase [Armatimonadetes bacterium]|nr:exo-alpha-sialidase [Armatimonadota bacterium]
MHWTWIVMTLSLAMVGLLLETALAEGKSLPQGVAEIVGVLGTGNSLVELKEGSLLSNDGRTSTDGGATWGGPRSFGEGVSGSGIMRLQSGKLALVSSVGYGSGLVWLSEDDGKTWAKAGQITVPGGPVFELGDTMIQLEGGPHKGRLVYCWDYNMSGNHPDIEPGAKSVGTWKGKPYITETHQHRPEYFAAGFSWSDDEGKSWQYGQFTNMPNILMGWFDVKGEPNGMGNLSPVGESSLAELRDGRVLLFGRSHVGRIVYSTSKDGGENWRALRPTDLANSGSPPRLRRIPRTGDLLCLWNQVSGEEIRRGYRRGRFSAAISRDDGATWENYKTIEVCGGLDNVARVKPDPKVQMVRARKNVGKVDDGYAFYHYANVNFAGDKVYVLYSRGYPTMGVAEQMSEKQEQVMRTYPLEWFYKP